MKKKNLLHAFVAFATILSLVTMTPMALGATTLRFSHYLPITHPGAKALAGWAKEIETKSKGTLKIRIFPSSQLFRITETFDAVSEGAVEMGFNGLFGEKGKNPVFAVLDIPYAFSSYKAIMKSCRGGLNDLLDKEANKLGVKVVAVGFADYAQAFTTKKLLKTPEDYKGVRVRVFPGSVGGAVKILGGAAVMMPTSDVYTALQRGVVDGHFGTVATAISRKFYEVEKYGVIGPFIFSPIHVIANVKTWNGLTPEQQQLMTQTLREMADNLVDVFKELTLVTGPKKLREKGMEIHIQTHQEIARFKEALKPAYDMYLKQAGAMGQKALDLTR